MNSDDLNKKRVMHIDTSCKLYERKDTGIAYKMIKTNEHKGMGIDLRLKKEIERDFDAQYDYPRLYAICIYFLIKEDLDKFDILVICSDEHIGYVREYLRLLFSEESRYSKKEVISIFELREITGNHKLRSYANNVANSYRRRVLKSKSRQQAGIPLNPVLINYRLISEKWIDIDEKIKNKL